MNISFFVKKNKVYLLFISIVCISIFLRFNRLSDIYVFNFDEEYQATYAWTQVKDLHPIWIGVSSSFLDFYLGPYFTYFTAILLKISNGNPMLTAYFAALLGVVNTVLVFLIGRKLFSLTAAVVSSLLYATMPIIVFFDQKYWNTMFTPTIALLLLLTLYLVKKSQWLWVGFAALWGIVLETHLEPAPLFLVGFYQFIKEKVWINFKLLLIGVLIFLIFYWPLIVFDFNHNFSNVTLFTRIRSGFSESKIVFDPNAKFRSLFDSMGRFWYLKEGNPNADEINFGCTSLSVKQELKFIDQYAKRTYAPIFLSLLTIAMLAYFIWIGLREKLWQCKLLSILLIISVISFLLFPGGSSEYYTLQFWVLFTFVPGILISSSSKKIKLIFIGLILVISLMGVRTIVSTSDEFSLGPKKILVSRVMEKIGENSFSIEGRGVCHDYEGWRYLFKVYGKVPSQSYTDKNLGWLYPEEISKETPIYTVILSEDRIPLKEDLSNLESIKEGGYRAYIRKNE